MNAPNRDKIEEIVGLLRSDLLCPEEGVPSGASKAVMDAVEQRVGIAFPDEVRAWLARTNAPCVGGGGMLGVGLRRKACDIEAVLEAFPVWKAKGWIPIAADGSGNYYVLVPPAMAVGFVDTTSDPGRVAFVVASRFLVFLEMFVRRARGETRWPFRIEETLAVDPSLEGFRLIGPMPWD